MSTANVRSLITVSNESIGSNTGTGLLLVSMTKTETDWGTSLENWEQIKYNAFSLLASAISTLKSNYAGKEIDFEGIVISES